MFLLFSKKWVKSGFPKAIFRFFEKPTHRPPPSAARIFATPNAFVSSDKHLRLTTEKSQRRAVEVDNNE